MCVFVSAVSISKEAVIEKNASSNVSKHEIILGSAPLFGLAGQTTGASATFNDGTSLGASVGYNYSLIPMLQIGTNSNVLHISSSGISITTLQLAVGPTINFSMGERSEELYNTMFVTIQGGLHYVKGASSSTTDGLITGEVGYRIRMMDHVIYRPSLGTHKVLDGSKALIIVRPVQFSVVF